MPTTTGGEHETTSSALISRAAIIHYAAGMARTQAQLVGPLPLSVSKGHLLQLLIVVVGAHPTGDHRRLDRIVIIM